MTPRAANNRRVPLLISYSDGSKNPPRGSSSPGKPTVNDLPAAGNGCPRGREPRGLRSARRVLGELERSRLSEQEAQDGAGGPAPPVPLAQMQQLGGLGPTAPGSTPSARPLLVPAHLGSCTYGLYGSLWLPASPVPGPCGPYGPYRSLGLPLSVWTLEASWLLQPLVAPSTPGDKPLRPLQPPAPHGSSCPHPTRSPIDPCPHQYPGVRSLLSPLRGRH